MVATARTYTDEERAQVLALIQTGKSQRDVSAELGIPLSTVNKWHVLALRAADGMDAKSTDYAELWGHASALAALLAADQLTRALEADERLPARDVRDLLVAGGISVDKALDYRDGRKTNSITVDNRSLALPPGLTADELRSIAFAPPPQIGEPDATT